MSKQAAIDYLRSGRFAQADSELTSSHAGLDPGDLAPLYAVLQKSLLSHETQADRRGANRVKRRIESLRLFESRGYHLPSLLARVDLQTGYHGKILLVAVTAQGDETLTILRGGDEWHREILANTREEVLDRGIHAAAISPLGGAWARVERRQVEVWGQSDDFGPCDKISAVALLQAAYPKRRVVAR